MKVRRRVSGVENVVEKRKFREVRGGRCNIGCGGLRKRVQDICSKGSKVKEREHRTWRGAGVEGAGRMVRGW